MMAVTDVLFLGNHKIYVPSGNITFFNFNSLLTALIKLYETKNEILSMQYDRLLIPSLRLRSLVFQLIAASDVQRQS